MSDAHAAPRPERFVRLAGRLGAVREAPSWATRVLAAYDEGHRHYHDAEHLAECLATLDRVRDEAKHPDLVEWALWFHDAVYGPAADDEERSAALLREMAADCGIDGSPAERAAELVLATRHDQEPRDADERVLLDCDLAILGAPPERFDRYEADVRAEYAHVPDAAFRTGRAEVLRRFLARPRLFHAEPLRIEREARARANLARSLARLETVAP